MVKAIWPLLVGIGPYHLFAIVVEDLEPGATRRVAAVENVFCLATKEALFVAYRADVAGY
jgi:hypothetical protein